MSDRLTDLQRQRTLVQEQLAWLDREIAAEASAKTQPSGIATAAPAPAPAPASAQGASGINPADSEAILAQYRNEPGSLKDEVRKGCFLYFALAFLAFGAAVFWLYLRTTARH